MQTLPSSLSLASQFPLPYSNTHFLAGASLTTSSAIGPTFFSLTRASQAKIRPSSDADAKMLLLGEKVMSLIWAECLKVVVEEEEEDPEGVSPKTTPR